MNVLKKLSFFAVMLAAFASRGGSEGGNRLRSFGQFLTVPHVFLGPCPFIGSVRRVSDSRGRGSHSPGARLGESAGWRRSHNSVARVVRLFMFVLHLWHVHVPGLLALALSSKFQILPYPVWYSEVE